VFQEMFSRLSFTFVSRSFERILSLAGNCALARAKCRPEAGAASAAARRCPVFQVSYRVNGTQTPVTGIWWRGRGLLWHSVEYHLPRLDRGA